MGAVVGEDEQVQRSLRHRGATVSGGDEEELAEGAGQKYISKKGTVSISWQGPKAFISRAMRVLWRSLEHAPCDLWGLEGGQ